MLSTATSKLRCTLARLRLDEGFTIIEVLVAAIVLAVGLLTAVMALAVGAQTSYTTRAREGAVNLAREVTEDSRSLGYGQISPSTLTSSLEAMPGLANQSGGATWQISRRGVTYTLTASETDIAAVSAVSAAEKQVTVGVSWKVEGVNRSISETATISSVASGNALPSNLQLISPTVSNPTQPQITSAATTQLTFQVTVPTGTTGVVWTVNGQQCQIVGTNTTAPCTVSGSGTTFTSPAWSISSLSDGTYYVGAAAVDSTGTVGASIKIPVQLVRGTPSAPTVTDYGFNPNLYQTAGTTSVVGELRWIDNPEANVVGYNILNSSGTVLCQVVYSGNWPGTCGQNGASFWCQTAVPSVNCIDLSPSASDTSSLTYQIQALYYNASNTLTAGPTTSVTLQPLAQGPWYLQNTTANTSTNCTAGASGTHDLSTSSPGAGSSSIQFSSSVNFCSPAWSSGWPFAPGGTLTAYFANPGSQNCTITINTNLNSTTGGSSASVIVPPTSGLPLSFNVTISPGTVTTAASGAREELYLSTGSGCGSNNHAPVIYYGSTTYPSKLTPLTVAPGAPSSLSMTTNADGSATLSWFSPSGGASPSFYRIYRGGQLYTNRYGSGSDLAIVPATSYDSDTGDGCQFNWLYLLYQCSYKDVNRSSPPYTYYVTTVGGTTAGWNMAEGAMTGGVTG